MGNRFKETFLKERRTNGQQVLENMFSIINQRNANQITMRYHLPSVRLAIIKKTKNNKFWQGCGEKGILVQH